MYVDVEAIAIALFTLENMSVSSVYVMMLLLCALVLVLVCAPTRSQVHMFAGRWPSRQKNK